MAFWTCQAVLVSIPLVMACVAEHHVAVAGDGGAGDGRGRRRLRLSIWLLHQRGYVIWKGIQESGGSWRVLMNKT